MGHSGSKLPHQRLQNFNYLGSEQWLMAMKRPFAKEASMPKA